MRPLIIGSEQLAEINAAVERARHKPLPLAKVSILAASVKNQDTHDLKLEDRPPGFERPASEHVLIPKGYRAAISFEHQPAGFCRHLSVSVDKPGKLPSVEAVKMICEAFGFRHWTPATIRIWLEEFDPGHQAVNVVQIEPS